jgi:glutathione synthase/RimK-type ligase-like ATP-grasp enzyme
MTPLRIGFLLPHYHQPSTSCMQAAMRTLAGWGVSVGVIHPRDRAVDLSTVRVEHDLYVLQKISGLATSIAGVLHAQGAAIVNPYPVTMALRDKIVTTRILQAAGVPTPATYVARRLEQLAPLLDGGPLIVKPCQGTEGFGVRIIRNPAELAAVPAGKDPLFAQRYHPPQGRDRKIYSIGDRLFGVKKIFPARTEEEKHGEPFTPTPELCEIARRCGHAFGVDLYGVDIIESDGKPYVVDMSTMPGFKGVPDAPSRLASYLYEAAKRAAGKPAAAPTMAAEHSVHNG